MQQQQHHHHHLRRPGPRQAEMHGHEKKKRRLADGVKDAIKTNRYVCTLFFTTECLKKKRGQDETRGGALKQEAKDPKERGG